MKPTVERLPQWVIDVEASVPAKLPWASSTHIFSVQSGDTIRFQLGKGREITIQIRGVREVKS